MWPFIINIEQQARDREEFAKMMGDSEKLSRWANQEKRKTHRERKNQESFGKSSEGKTVEMGDIGFVCEMGFGTVESICDIFADVRLYYNNAIFTVPLSEHFRINVNKSKVNRKEYF